MLVVPLVGREETGPQISTLQSVRFDRNSENRYNYAVMCAKMRKRRRKFEEMLRVRVVIISNRHVGTELSISLVI